VDADGDLSGNIHNATRWEVTGVVIRLTLYTQASTPKGWQIVSSPCSDAPTQIPADGKSFLVRDYALDTRIKPLSVNTFSEKGGIIQVKEDWYGCQITGAQGLVERPTLLRRRPRSSGIPTPAGHQQEWWIPAIYTFLGAVIGFLSDRLKIWWDSRAVKKAFLSAIRVELEGLQEQLTSLKKEVLNAKERLEKSERYPGQFAVSFRRTIFETQLGTLRDLSDPVLLELIRIYSDMSVLPGIIELLNEHGRECIKLWEKPERDGCIKRVISGSKALVETADGFRARISAVLPKLPAPSG